MRPYLHLNVSPHENSIDCVLQVQTNKASLQSMERFAADRDRDFGALLQDMQSMKHFVERQHSGTAKRLEVGDYKGLSLNADLLHLG